MKILFASEIFPPDIGGPATYVEKIASQLKADGQQVVVLTYSRGSHFLDDKKYQFLVFRISRKHHLWLRYFLYFFKLLRLSKDADVIFAQGPIPSGLPSIIVKFFTGKKVVIKVVGDFSWERSMNLYGLNFTIDEFQKQKHSLKIKFIRWLQKIVLNKADLVITPSYYLKTIVKGWGVKEEKIKVIYNAIEQIFCSLTKERAKEKIGVTGDLLISAGRLVPWKGFGFLIKILPKILEINENFKLIIIGDGPEKDKLEKLIKESNLAEQVRLTGQVTHQDLAVYFKAADFFILNTSYEGLSHLLVEALMSGLPVITTNIGGNPEIIQDNYNGLLVNFNNEQELILAIKKLWQDKNLQNKFIDNSKSSLEKFQFEEMFIQTIGILKSLLGSQ